MCNLYSHTTSQDAMRRLFAGLRDLTGNLAPQDRIYPDQMAPVVRLRDGAPELVMHRWGMPTPASVLGTRRTDRGVTNIRNTASPHWRRWLGPAHRCLVPFTTFNEPDAGHGGSAWFALADPGAQGFFAGIATRWTSVRRLRDGQTTDDLFGFLTTRPNALVAAVHPKAMPVILTRPADWDRWLTAPWDDAAALQRPMDDDELVIVERDEPKATGDDDQLTLFD